jgi:hypothetical protein
VPGVYGLIQSICCWKMMEKLYKQYWKVAFKLNDVGMVTDAVGRYW